MQDLHLVGFTTDRRHLIFSTRRGAKSGSFLVPVDEELVTVVADLAAEPADSAEDETSSDEEIVAPPPPRVEAKLTVREVQARLRAGESVAEVAADAGVAEDWVERFAPPVRAEQRQIVERALRLSMERSRAGESAKPLGVAVASAMAERGVVFTDEGFASAWTSRLIGQDHWVIEFHFTQRGRRRTVGWTFDAADGRLTTSDRTASQIGFVAPPASKSPTRKSSGESPSKSTTETDVDGAAQGPRSTRGDGRPDTVRSTKAVAAAKESTKKALASRPAAAKKQAAAAKKAAAEKSTAGKSAPKKKSSAKKKKSAAKKTSAPKKSTSKKKSAPTKSAAKKKSASKRPAAKKPAPKASGTKKQTPAPKTPTARTTSAPEKSGGSKTPAAEEKPVAEENVAPPSVEETSPVDSGTDEVAAPEGDAVPEPEQADRNAGAAETVADDDAPAPAAAGSDAEPDPEPVAEEAAEGVRVIAVPADDEPSPDQDNRVRVRRPDAADAPAGDAEPRRPTARPTAAFRSGAAVRASSAPTSSVEAPDGARRSSIPDTASRPASRRDAPDSGPQDSDAQDRPNGRRPRRTRQLRAR